MVPITLKVYNKAAYLQLTSFVDSICRLKPYPSHCEQLDTTDILVRATLKVWFQNITDYYVNYLLHCLAM